MSITLADITTLTAGYHFREKVPTREDGALAVVQMKNISEQGVIQVGQLDQIALFPRHENYLLRPNDILLLSRGSRNTAAIVPGEFPLAVAAAYFIIIRIISNEILPEYLAVYLNHPKTQGRIKDMACGTALPVVSISALTKLTIDIPSPETQRTIVSLCNQVRKAEEAELLIQKKRSQLIEQMVTLAIEEANGRGHV